MLNLPRLVPHIMDQVNLDTPGWSLKAQLVTLVAWRTQEPDSWTELGTRQLTEALSSLGGVEPTPWDVKWARVVLGRLADEHRILERVPGSRRRADLWRLRGDRLDQIREWRHVPWLRSARATAASLRALETGVASGEKEEPLANTGDFSGECPVGTRFGHLGDLDLSVKEPDTPPKEPDTPPKNGVATRENAAGTGHSPENSERSSQCLLDSYGVRQSVEAGDGSGDGRTDDAAQHARAVGELARRLVSAINGVVPDPIYGREPKARVRALAEAHLERGDQLVERARTVTGCRRWGGVLDVLEAWEPAAEAPRDLAGELARARRLLATLVDQDPDSPRIGQLRARVAEARNRSDHHADV